MVANYKKLAVRLISRIQFQRSRSTSDPHVDHIESDHPNPQVDPDSSQRQLQNLLGLIDSVSCFDYSIIRILVLWHHYCNLVVESTSISFIGITSCELMKTQQIDFFMSEVMHFSLVSRTPPVASGDPL